MVVFHLPSIMYNKPAVQLGVTSSCRIVSFCLGSRTLDSSPSSDSTSSSNRKHVLNSVHYFELTVLFFPLYLCVHIESCASRVSTFNIRLKTCGSHDPKTPLVTPLLSLLTNLLWYTMNHLDFTAGSVLCSFYWDNWHTGNSGVDGNNKREFHIR